MKKNIPICFEDKDLIPQYAHDYDAGCDLKSKYDYVLLPNRVTSIDTGIRIKVPEGYVVDVRSRSGLATEGIFVINSPGTIDPYYTGVIRVLLFNTTEHPVYIQKGWNVAQLICHKFVKINWLPVCKEVLTVDDDKRGDNGFGSTGR